MTQNANISISFFLRFFTPQNDRWNLSFVKDKCVVGQAWPDMVQKWLFISCYFLGVRRTRTGPHATSEAITFDPIKI